MATPSLLVFGPQTIWPTAEHLAQLRAALLLEPRLRTFLTAIKELPALGQTLVHADPRLIPILRPLEDVQMWIDQGEFPSMPDEAPNVLSTPLTVIIQIIQYFHYVDGKAGSPTHGDLLESVRVGGIQGFCTGLLTAIAIACSKNEEDASIFGVVALRLALCIGAFVDLEGALVGPQNEACCLAVRWRSEMSIDKVLDVLKGYKDVSMSHGQREYLRKWPRLTTSI